ncbi:hypothetical protein [Nocardiopsis sp. JB363]|uniref:hypothetical protein n=1 Tax=Nocardiopsis sp. JB363 TaxID=1434837 RepID=UPI00097B64EF|nr:hypothetical protein [Nocardiopsis sp. JB363]SIO90037.1 hypothetical protein BQ8420_24640 [Nocardiopsis sp. JB363]
MNGTRRRVGIMVGIAAVLTAALYPLMDLWVLVAAPILLLFGGLVLMFGSTRPAVPGQTETPPDPFMESGPRNTRIKDAPLSSRDEHYSFLFSAMVMWRWTGTPDPRLRNPAGQAQRVVFEQAGKDVARFRPEHHDVARHQLAADLGVAVYAYEGALEVWAEDVELTLSDDDMTRLERLARVRKESVLWEVEKSVESAKRRYYADDVLATPGSAIVWDLVRGDVDVGRTHGLIETLARLAEASKGEDLSDLLTRLRGAAPEEFAFLGDPGPDAPDDSDAPDVHGFEAFDPHGASIDHGPPNAYEQARLILSLYNDDDEDTRTQDVHRQVQLLERAGAWDIARELRRLYPLPDDEDFEEAEPAHGRRSAFDLAGADWIGHETDTPTNTRNGDGAPLR